MNIGILTGGGDVPGLNPCIKQVTYRALDEGHSVTGIFRGWGGLLNLNPSDPASLPANTIALDKLNTRTIDRTGGTILWSSRTNPAKTAPAKAPEFLRGNGFDPNAKTLDFTPHVLSVLAYLKLDVLIAIGGDDTLSYGARLHKEGFPVILIPKTMDNDVTGTDYCIGFSTAITRSISAINKLRTTTGSHERLGIIELFGRNAGHTSLVSAYLSSADRCLISEVPFEIEHLAELLMKDKRANPRNYAMLTVSEGARSVTGEIVEREKQSYDPYGHKKLGGIGQVIAADLERITGQATVPVALSFLMRSGPADTLDQMVARTFAHCAMDLLESRTFGRMVAVRDGRYTHVDASEPAIGPRQVDVEALYDKMEYRPRLKRALDLPMFLR
ncbi:6-phosphofructokinase [Leptolinea tardivitalis]|uniref:Phosphofructokinase n=1 Tax=Leptolinea tardivitalis TaxID=229920 RepID=A0A0P6XFT6_9CHLR|nr:6-phosphofructokinase [Leptolinea tardivitalis]KPL74072.1 phosphofructokinase [Leptolinea tardivitalis]GAP22720.1 pyrophosphate-dependent phosphofructokinase [Leptolinea tardivitalis]